MAWEKSDTLENPWGFHVQGAAVTNPSGNNPFSSLGLAWESFVPQETKALVVFALSTVSLLMECSFAEH